MPSMTDSANALTIAIANATKWLPNLGTQCLEEVRGAADALRKSDPAQDPIFGPYHGSGDGTGIVNDAQARQLDTMAYVLGRYAQATDTEGIRWLAGHPELLDALADLQDARREYHDRLVAKHAEYCKLRREQVEETERKRLERERLMDDLPEVLASLRAEARAGK